MEGRIEMNFIPYGKQWIDEDDIKAVVEVLQSDYLTTGPKIAEFESSLKKVTGAKNALAISNGTAALHCAINILDLKEGDEVITSPITFAASANSSLYYGVKPIFADIDMNTYNINPEQVEKKITELTKAIVAVDFTGQPCDYDSLRKIADKHNLVLIADAAHSLGATYKGKRVGEIADITTMSFHPVKLITSGEGGAILTNNDNFHKKAELFRSHGITRNKELMIDKEAGDWYYEMISLGYNYRLTDIQCALGISQLNKLKKFLARRREIAKKYDEAFSKLDYVITPKQLDGTNSAWHLYILKFKLKELGKTRREIFDFLKSKNVGVNVHYIPVYKLPYYQKLGYKDFQCPNAEEYYETAITIPLFPKMTDEEVAYVIEQVKKVDEV
ncbi:MAG: UDP-4-amino-4,6-dideoxy-N-acetyl-beta-L-altrosamine transaminase [Tissierellia bacterium]|nr:UDP-4-amino-4,6-dideoxy-N-acetyl-beta-L-altrosamine transaminase [Tissierellia bacterium]